MLTCVVCVERKPYHAYPHIQPPTVCDQCVHALLAAAGCDDQNDDDDDDAITNHDPAVLKQLLLERAMGLSHTTQKSSTPSMRRAEPQSPEPANHTKPRLRIRVPVDDAGAAAAATAARGGAQAGHVASPIHSPEAARPPARLPTTPSKASSQHTHNPTPPSVAPPESRRPRVSRPRTRFSHYESSDVASILSPREVEMVVQVQAIPRPCAPAASSTRTSPTGSFSGRIKLPSPSGAVGCCSSAVAETRRRFSLPAGILMSRTDHLDVCSAVMDCGSSLRLAVEAARRSLLP